MTPQVGLLGAPGRSPGDGGLLAQVYSTGNAIGLCYTLNAADVLPHPPRQRADLALQQGDPGGGDGMVMKWPGACDRCPTPSARFSSP